MPNPVAVFSLLRYRAEITTIATFAVPIFRCDVIRTRSVGEGNLSFLASDGFLESRGGAAQAGDLPDVTEQFKSRFPAFFIRRTDAGNRGLACASTFVT